VAGFFIRDRMGGMIDGRMHMLIFAITALVLLNSHRGPKLSARFGVRTLLIVTTVVAVVLGVAVYLVD
jgi:Na+/melibiose symporter-like transporter